MRAIVGISLCLVASSPALAAPPLDRDQVTVSGRFSLPKADGVLKGRMWVRKAEAQPADIAVFLANPQSFNTNLAEAAGASLRNFGYLGPEAADAVAVDIALASLEKGADSNAISVTARLQISPTGDAATIACIPRSAEGRYRAMHPMKAGDGQRGIGIFAVVAMAAVGVNGADFLTSQFQSAKAQDDALNATRSRTESEGVSPLGGDKQVTRYAALNATRLATADFIRQLSKSCGAAAPAATAAPTAAAPTGSAPMEPTKIAN